MTARILSLLGLRLRQEVLEQSGTWWFLLTLVVQAVLGPLVGLFVWSTVYPDDPHIGLYYVAVILVTLMTESFEQHTFSSRIYDGTISHELLRPQPVIIGVLGTNLAIRAWLTTMGLPIVLLAGLAVGESFDWQAIVRSLPFVVLAAALMFLWTFVLSISAFWTDQVHAIVGFGSYLVFLLGGSAAPVELLPEPWRDIAEVLPFYGMIGLPAEIATGRQTSTGLLYQLGWVCVLAAAAVWLWRRGVRHYAAVGS